MRVRYNLGAISILYFAMWGCLCATAFAVLMWYIHFGDQAFANRWVYVMMVHTIVWGFLCPYQICYLFLLFHVTCYMFGLQLDRFHRDIAELKSTFKTKLGHLKLNRLLNKYLEICQDIQAVNKFWSGFLGMSYFIYLTIFTILVFNVFFAVIPSLTKWMWSGLVLCQMQILAFIAYSGDIVSRKVTKHFLFNNFLYRFNFFVSLKAFKPYVLLASIHAKENLPLRLKLKVN